MYTVFSVAYTMSELALTDKAHYTVRRHDEADETDGRAGKYLQSGFWE